MIDMQETYNQGSQTCVHGVKYSSGQNKVNVRPTCNECATVIAVERNATRTETGSGNKRCPLTTKFTVLRYSNDFPVRFSQLAAAISIENVFQDCSKSEHQEREGNW